MCELVYRTFDDYVKDFPEGERFRNWITDVRPVTKSSKKMVCHNRRVLILKGTGPHSGIPGGYLWVSPIVYTKDGRLAIAIHDCDDGLMIRECKDQTEVDYWFEMLESLVPFDMSELTEFGFRVD